jgi:predicted MFS family arabinose efflux permease
MPKISQWLIDDFGWRGGYTGMSIIILFVGLPLVFALARPNPATVGASSVGHPEGEKTAEGLTVPEALRTFSYYKVFFAIMFASMTLIGTLSHSRIMLEEHGFSANLATTAASISFAGVLLGELSAGLLLDRFQSPRAVLPYFLSALVGVLIFHTASGSVPILLGGALLMGMGLGGEVGMNAYLVSRYCGLKSFATLYGGTFAASNLGIAIGIFTMGKVHDSAGSYDPMVYVFGTTMLISVLSIASLGPFVYKAKSSH